MRRVKKLATKSFNQKLGGNLKPLCFRQSMHTQLTELSPLCPIPAASGGKRGKLEDKLVLTKEPGLLVHHL